MKKITLPITKAPYQKHKSNVDESSRISISLSSVPSPLIENNNIKICETNSLESKMAVCIIGKEEECRGCKTCLRYDI